MAIGIADGFEGGKSVYHLMENFRFEILGRKARDKLCCVVSKIEFFRLLSGQARA